MRGDCFLNSAGQLLQTSFSRQVQARFKDFDDFELVLKDSVQRELRGRQSDWMHTLAVVQNMKRLVSVEGGKRDILVPLAYVHEIARPKGDVTVLYPGRTAVLQRCAFCAEHAKTLLLSLGFPEDKAINIARLLESNECMELKRAHHAIL